MPDDVKILTRYWDDPDLHQIESYISHGGYAGLRRAPPDTPAPVLVDVAPTIATLLGLRLPRRLDGTPLAAELVGHPLLAVLADAQSPH